MTRILSILFCILAATAVCTAQSVVYFPQIAEGVQPGGIQWGMVIAITNPNGSLTSGTITLTKDDGTPFSLSLTQYGAQTGSGSASSFPFQLAPGQTTTFLSPGESGHSTTPLQTGFAMLSSNLPVAATLIFSEFGPSGRIAQAGVSPATPIQDQAMIAIAPGPSGPSNIYPPNTATSGIAIANVGNLFANVSFFLADANGQAVPNAAPVGIRLGPNNHMAIFVNQIFPNATTFAGGRLSFTSDKPLVATALLFQSNGEFGTTPVFPYP